MLLFDVGNTQIKWMYESESGAIEGACSSGSLSESLVLDLKARLPEVSQIGLSCVKSNEYQQTLSEHLNAVFGVQPFIAKVDRESCGVVCSYEEPARMGVDRWLAMLAVRDRVEGAFCVVDAGSATTFDWVSANGIHEGGYILSGLRLSVQALLAGTDQVIVDMDRLNVATLDPGKSTTDAVYNGALFALHSQIEAAYHRLQALAGSQECSLILTGGDAKLLSHQLNVPHELVGNLVFDGLKVMLKASERA